MSIKAKYLVNKKIRGFLIKDWKRQNKQTYLYVECPYCHNMKWMRSDGIVSSKSKIISCGCYNKTYNYKKPTNITNKAFGRLKAIRSTNERSLYNGSVIWECVCVCGNIKCVPYSELINGHVKSCGCLGNENSIKNGKKVADYMKENYYAQNTSMLALIASKPSTNTSGVKGVSWRKDRNKWCAQIVFQGKHYHLGLYDKIEDAAEARRIAEEHLTKDFVQWFKENRKEQFQKLLKNKRFQKEEFE